MIRPAGCAQLARGARPFPVLHRGTKGPLLGLGSQGRTAVDRSEGRSRALSARAPRVVSRVSWHPAHVFRLTGRAWQADYIGRLQGQRARAPDRRGPTALKPLTAATAEIGCTLGDHDNIQHETFLKLFFEGTQVPFDCLDPEPTGTALHTPPRGRRRRTAFEKPRRGRSPSACPTHATQGPPMPERQDRQTTLLRNAAPPRSSKARHRRGVWG